MYEVEEICIFHPKGHNLVILGNKDKKRAVIYTPFQPKKEVAKQYHHTMADYSYYTWVVSSKVGASRGRNIKIGELKLSGQTKVVLLPYDCFFLF